MDKCFQISCYTIIITVKLGSHARCTQQTQQVFTYISLPQMNVSAPKCLGTSIPVKRENAYH